jgi:hypothetical protein
MPDDAPVMGTVAWAYSKRDRSSVTESMAAEFLREGGLSKTACQVREYRGAAEIRGARSNSMIGCFPIQGEGATEKVLVGFRVVRLPHL